MLSGPGALLCASSFRAAVSFAVVMGVRSTAAAGCIGSVGPVYGVGGAAQWESRRYSAKVWACCERLVGLPCESLIATGLGLQSERTLLIHFHFWRVVIAHDVYHGVELGCLQQPGGVPKGAEKVVLRWGLDIVLGSALLAGLGNVCFEPVCSGASPVSGVVSGLPLFSVLWGWSGVCVKVVGGAVGLKRFCKSRRNCWLLLSVVVLGCDAAAVCGASAVVAGVRECGR